MGLRVLIVDDSTVMRKMILRSLRQAGYPVDDVREAADGEEALRLFDPSQVDVVFTDLNMPGMDGIEFVRRIRERARSVPILLITAEAGKGKIAQALSRGVTAFLSKPPQPEELREKLGEVLGRESHVARATARPTPTFLRVPRSEVTAAPVLTHWSTPPRFFVPGQVKHRFRELADSMLRHVLECWGAAIHCEFVPEPSGVTIVENYEVDPIFIGRDYFALASVESALRGETAFLLPLPFAVTIGALMCMAPLDSIEERRKAVTVNPADLDAIGEACNLMCGACARAMSRLLARDVSVTLLESRSVDLQNSPADFNDVLRWRPFVALQSAVRVSHFPAAPILQLWPLDLANRLAVLLGFPAAVARLEGIAVCVSEEPGVQLQVARALDGHPIATLAVHDPAGALAVAEKHTVTALVLDAGSDFHGALARCRWFRAEKVTQALPIILLSALPKRESIIEAILAGARDWLALPLDPATAGARIAKHALRKGAAPAGPEKG